MVIRKSLKILIVCACTVALALAAGGCRKKPQPPPPGGIEGQPDTTPDTTTVTTTDDVTTETAEPPMAGDDQLQVVPSVGLGPVRFGMSKEQVIELLGQPDRIDAGGMALQYLGSKGVSLMLDPMRGVRAIDCWSKEYPQAPPELTTFAGKTKQGIAMGAGREQIVAAYGEPDRTIPRGALETLLYNELGAQFVLAENKLVNMRIRAPR